MNSFVSGFVHVLLFGDASVLLHKVEIARSRYHRAGRCVILHTSFIHSTVDGCGGRTLRWP